MPALSGAASERSSSERLVAACLERVEQRESDVRAWEALDGERALAEARERDGEQPRSAIHGVPVGVKDLIDTADMPTAYGSPIYAGHRPAADAACVARLRAAGAVVLGKTATTEFATYHPSKARNPHDLTRTPGGSSAGSAAAVAAGMAPLALGTQTAGSIVRPASFCGVFGFKPSYGTVAREGVYMLSDRLDTIGALGADIDGLALLVAAMAGSELTPRDTDGPARVGVYRTEHWSECDADGRAAIGGAAERLAAAGAEVGEASLPRSFGDLVGAHETIMAVDVSHALAGEHERHREQLSPELVGLIEQGRAAPRETYTAALELADRCALDLGAVLADYDVLLTPGVKGEAPSGLGATGDPLFCRPWSLLGVPAISVPGLTGDSGMPIGVQLIAPHGADALLLGVARWVGRELESQGSRR